MSGRLVVAVTVSWCGALLLGPTARTATCAGTLTLTASQVLGHVRFTIPVADECHVTVALAAPARGVLKRRSALPVKLQAVYRTGSKWTPVTQRFTLRRQTSTTRGPAGAQQVAVALRRVGGCATVYVASPLSPRPSLLINELSTRRFGTVCRSLRSRMTS